jgi:hypothetical protein
MNMCGAAQWHASAAGQFTLFFSDSRCIIMLRSSSHTSTLTLTNRISCCRAPAFAAYHFGQESTGQMPLFEQAKSAIFYLKNGTFVHSLCLIKCLAKAGFQGPESMYVKV